jgi:ectoine hydroxylase-related dioxygenase (phytanoyl-CoA dioxygenase family)
MTDTAPISSRTTTPARPPAEKILDEFDHRGFVVLRDAYDARDRADMLTAARRLLASDLTPGRDRGGDGKDGFRGCLALDDAFLPLLANPRTLPTVTALLSPNIHLLSAHLIALPFGPPRTIRIPERTGWHRDMYGVTADLGVDNTPLLAVKVAHYLTPPDPNCGITMFLPGSHRLTRPPTIPPGKIDPSDAVTPSLTPCDAVVFENRTWHAGGVNLSDAPRIAVMMQYGYRWLQCVDDPTPDALTRPDLTAVERQLLGAPDRNSDGSLAKGTGSAPLRQWWNHLRSQDSSQRPTPNPAASAT